MDYWLNFKRRRSDGYDGRAFYSKQNEVSSSHLKKRRHYNEEYLSNDFTREAQEIINYLGVCYVTTICLRKPRNIQNCKHISIQNQEHGTKSFFFEGKEQEL